MKLSKREEFIISKENIERQIKKHNTTSASWIISKRLHILRFLLLISFFMMGIYSLINMDVLLLSVSFFYFILDFIFYRYTSIIKYQRELLIVKRIIEGGFYNIYFSKDNFEDAIVKKQYNSSSRSGALKPGYDYTTYKERILLNEFSNFSVENKNVLDVGGAEGDSSCILNKKNKLIISDPNLCCLSSAKKRGITVVQAISESIPFKNGLFDMIIFTEVIEHLQNPFITLKEIRRVLKDDGVLILTTGNNRSFLSAFCINPIILLEKMIGQYYDIVLPPRRLISTDQHTYYHVNYSRDDINEILKSSGFTQIRLYTFGHLLFLSPVLPLDFIMKLSRPLTGLKLTRYMGTGYCIISKKADGGHK